MIGPACTRCPGALPLPAVTVEVEGRDGRYSLCLAHFLERERIEPTARKGGKPSVPLRANPARAKLPVKP